MGLFEQQRLIKHSTSLPIQHLSRQADSSICTGFPHSQIAVYGHPEQYPLFLDNGFQVNIDLLMHTANFFKYHMTREDENTLFTLFKELKDDQKPRAWDSQLQQGRGVPGVKKIGSHWKGSYGKFSAAMSPNILLTLW